MTLDIDGGVAAIKDAFKAINWKICVDRGHAGRNLDGEIVLWYLLVPEGEWPRSVQLMNDVGARLTDALPNATLSLKAVLNGGNELCDELDALLAQLPVKVEVNESDEKLTELALDKLSQWKLEDLPLTLRVSLGTINFISTDPRPIELSSLFSTSLIEKIEDAAIQEMQ